MYGLSGVRSVCHDLELGSLCLINFGHDFYSVKFTAFYEFKLQVL